MFLEGNTDGTLGGSYYSLFFLVEALDRSRYQPVVVFRREIAFVDRFRQAGIEVHIKPRPAPYRWTFLRGRAGGRSPLIGIPVGALETALNFLRLFVWSGLSYAVFLKRQRIDLVHLNNSVTRNHDAMLGALLTRTRALTHERGINVRYSWLARFLGERLGAVICISEAVRAAMIEHRVVPDARLHVIHNGLDQTRICPQQSPTDVRARWNVEAGQPVLTMIGNIKWWKGQEILVRALEHVVPRFPGVVCLFVGDTAEPDRDYDETLQALIDRLGLRANVRFTGYQENVADFLAAADIAVHASATPEPFGRVLLEAMALAKPLVGSRAGAVPEIIVEGETGRMFEQGNAKDLAACILGLLNDPAGAAAMGRRGRERLELVFDLRQNVRRTEALYERLLEVPNRTANVGHNDRGEVNV
jgi:glycosyltransferase involved in cell wall biosynthesis